jgi:hypothetical protein
VFVIEIRLAANLIAEMKFLWTMLVFGTYAIAGYAQDVTVQQKESVDFSSFATYAWKQEEVARYPAIHEAILENVDEQLAHKGLRKVDASAHPDLLVRYTGERQVKTVQRSTSSNNIWRENGGTATVGSHKTAVGRLELIVTQAAAGEAVWTASGTHALTEIDDQKNRKIIGKLVKKMFQQFPSRKQKE